MEMTIVESEPKLCTACGGSGYSMASIPMYSNCSEPCKLCGGTGKIIVTRTIINDYSNNPIKPPYEVTC